MREQRENQGSQTDYPAGDGEHLESWGRRGVADDCLMVAEGSLESQGEIERYCWVQVDQETPRPRAQHLASRLAYQD